MSVMPRFHTRITDSVVEVATDRLTFRMGDGVLQSVEDFALSLYGAQREVRVLMLEEAGWIDEAQHDTLAGLRAKAA